MSKKQLFLDSNIWLRFLLDGTPQSKSCHQLIIEIVEKELVPMTSTIVLLELGFVLMKKYQLSQKDIQTYIDQILDTPKLKIIEATQTLEAWKLHLNSGVKFADCSIALQVPKSATLVTYDRDFAKISIVKSKTPAELLFY